MAGFLLALYGAVVAVIVFWPTPVDRNYRGWIGEVLEVLSRYGIPPWLGYKMLEFSTNVLMFIPLGLLIFFVLPRGRRWIALLACPALSTAIEITQGLALTERFARVSDVVANSTGGIIGVLLAILVCAVLKRRSASARRATADVR